MPVQTKSQTILSVGLLLLVVVGCQSTQCQTSSEVLPCDSFPYEERLARPLLLTPPIPTAPQSGLWPADTKGLVFQWNHKLDIPLKKWGKARIDEDGIMQLANGAFLAEHANQSLLSSCKQSNQLSIEAVIIPEKKIQRGPARIITFSSNTNSRNFTIGQEEDRLILRLRTPRTGNNGTNPEVVISRLQAGKRYHVVVTFQPGRLHCYLDGKLVVNRDDIRGGFQNWSEQHLMFGDEWDRNRDWAGGIERIAIFNRSIGEREVQESYTRSLVKD